MPQRPSLPVCHALLLKVRYSRPLLDEAHRGSIVWTRYGWHIRNIATYDTVPLDIDVGIISSLGGRYFELRQKLDRLMPLLQTLEIEEVLTARDADHQRAVAKKLVIGIASATRQLASGIRRRLNDS